MRTVPESKGMVKVWDHGDVPVAASQRKRLERVEVVGDKTNDHFQEFIWKAVGRSVCSMCLWRRIAKQAIDVGFASTPNDPHVS
jgi:hypothetical protein